MSPAQPDGVRWPGDGSLGPDLVEVDRRRPLSLYVHVPFCRVRCGYCDFNTYTVGFGPGAQVGDYAPSVLAEARLAARVMADAGMKARRAQTVFFGGGTPTMLATAELIEILRGLDEAVGISEDAEVTLEANPDSVTRSGLRELAHAGFTRVSFGMQSAVPHVLKVLERTHEPARVPRVVEWARRAGLSTSLDLIYGAPGESLEDWQRSLDAVTRIGPDHVSAYALVIEEGTRMWGQVRRGELPMPEDDDEATKYEMADAALGQAGYECYEISNWARPGSECRHNQAYWLDWDWWGAGPGAHSHLGDVRLWNTKHPVAWAGQIATGHLPVAGHEVIDTDSRELERIMLGIRLREGIELAGLDGASAGPCDDIGSTPSQLAPVVSGLVTDGLLDAGAAMRGRAVLTLRGRLMADIVTRALTR